MLARAVVLVAVMGAALTQGVWGRTVSTPRQVVVQPGQTLWGIAVSRYPSQDPRIVVAAIESANHLHGALLRPGWTLRLPALPPA